ncbi:MAG: GAF domain-containing protein [Flavobacteriales bacterium]|nr:GAF domain-containing protein [Flavobacteriales bacterium]
MSDSIVVKQNESKEELYASLIPQIEALVHGETDAVAVISNIIAALRQGMGWWWVGVYFVKNDELILGPFQGEVACFRIKLGQGVCGTAWKNKEALIVDNVDEFPGHIACSSSSKSEIVIPVLDKNDNVLLVLDIDSDQFSDFDEIDKNELQKVAALIKNVL